MDNADLLIARYPKLYHMAESGNWSSIRKHGLLSTSALLDLFQVCGKSRFRIESQWRCSSVAIQHIEHGTAVIRDQNPMPPELLKRVLQDMSPQEWYEFLNRRTFFWVSEHRLRRLLNGRLYRGRSHTVFTVDTKSLLERHFHSISLSPINSGFARFGKPERGRVTFQGINQYPLGDRIRHKGLDAVVELAVEYSVPDLQEVVLSVAEWRGNDLLDVIWER